MTQFYPLKQFEVVHGEGDAEAHAYGPGAFCWFYAEGVRYIAFLTTDQYYKSDKYVSEHVPVEPVEFGPHWKWDGNEDSPNLNPSILCKTKMPVKGPDGKVDYDRPWEWQEKFHGWIRNGHLEML